MSDERERRGLLPMTAVSLVVVLVVVGQARGMLVSNLHNGLLALTFTLVGAYVLFQRPGHRAGVLFLVAGVVEAVLFLGRQVGHFPGTPGDRWLAWLGVWPVSLALAIVTVSVICFPDGRLPSARWRWVVLGVLAVTGLTAAMSALWPVEYAATGVQTTHPLGSSVPGVVDALWSALAHPSYVVLQAVWIVALADRWRTSDARVRRQLGWLVAAAGVSVAALLLGLAVARSPTAGLLSATLLPVTAGWAIVHRQQRATHAALTWASGTGTEPDDLPDDLAEAVASALSARAAVLWMGPAHDLHPIGVWPPGTDGEPSTLAALDAAPGSLCRPVLRQAEVVGALSVRRDVHERLSVAERRLLDGLTGQAALVIDRVGLAVLVERQRRAGHLDDLTPRERDVLELMARGLTNAAICDQLHLSVKTVEPVVSAIFAKLGLHLDPASNRRVLAALAYHQRR